MDVQSHSNFYVLIKQFELLEFLKDIRRYIGLATNKSGERLIRGARRFDARQRIRSTPARG